MKQSVIRFIKERQLLERGKTVVVGVSGGPDSLALLHFFWDIRNQDKLTIIAAHVDHMFRGEESYKDYLFVEHFCKEKEIIFEGTRIDVKAYQKSTNKSSQMAARECRYHFFETVMKKYQASYLALGHHGDDQVETMVMKQVRGTYGFALAGIPISRSFANGRIIRPFLGITKHDIELYCQEKHLQPRLDQSNFTDTYVRNRIRNNVLPVLKKENPMVHQQFQRQSEWIQEDEHYLEGLAKKELEQVIEMVQKKYLIISVKAFSLVANPLQRRMIHLILRYLYGKNYPSLTSVHISAITSLLMEEKTTGEIHLPLSLFVVRSYNRCIFSFKTATANEEFSLVLPIPGMVYLEIGEISGEIIPTLEKEKLGKSIFVCDFDLIKQPLIVRNRKDGDKITPIGMEGSKKISRLFIDNKIPKELREKWPIVVDGNGNVIWVPTLAKSKIAETSRETNHYLLLSFTMHDDTDIIARSGGLG